MSLNSIQIEEFYFHYIRVLWAIAIFALLVLVHCSNAVLYVSHIICLLTLLEFRTFKINIIGRIFIVILIKFQFTSSA